MLHGDAASANARPARYADTAGGKLSFRASKSAPNDGKATTITSSRFKPIATARMDMATGRNPLASPPTCPYALPAVAAPTPRSASVDARPAANANPLTTSASAFAFAAASSRAARCVSVSSSGTSLPPSVLGPAYPPMYPMVSGRTLRVHGESEVTRPAMRTTANVIGVTLSSWDPTTESALCAAEKSPMEMSSPTDPRSNTTWGRSIAAATEGASSAPEAETRR